MNDKRRREVEAALMTMQLGDIRASTPHNPFYAEAGRQVGVLSIEGVAWGEMDFPADVKRDEKITSAWVHPGEFNRAAVAG